MNRLSRNKFRFLLSGLAAAVLSGLLLSSSADATVSVRQTPWFDCYSATSSVPARIVIHRPYINHDGYTTVWGAKILRWNGHEYRPYTQFSPYSFEDSVFGELAESDEEANVPANGYYRVAEVFGQLGPNGETVTPTGTLWAQANRRYVGTYGSSVTCKT